MKLTLCSIKAKSVYLFVISLFFVLFFLCEGVKADTFSSIPDYEEYLSHYTKAAYPQDTVILHGKDCIITEGDVRVISDSSNNNIKYLYSGSEGYCEWSFDIKKTGFYNILVRYMPDKGKNSSIMRNLYIDGHIPFIEARNITFKRIWIDANKVMTDNRGNDLNPMHIQTYQFLVARLEDTAGYYNEYLRFYFTEGKHTLRLESVQEPMLIDYIKIYNDKTPTYEQLKQTYREKGYKEAGPDNIIKIQAEDAIYRSDSSLRAKNDRSSPNTEPSSPSNIKLNAFGGDSWRMPGQWAIWEFDVPQSGLYKIVLKYKQNYKRSLYVTRKLEIDGITPCVEMNNLTFTYNSVWVNKALGEAGTPYLVYLEKGNHQLRLEASMGEMSEFLHTAVNSLNKLNKAYRSIFAITGTVPDPFRDYQFDKRLPEVFETFKEQIKELSEMSADLQKLTGERGSEISILESLVFQMEKIVSNPDTIRDILSNFKSNLGSLGTWILVLKEQPLLLDYILFEAPDSKIPAAESGLLKKIMYELKSMISSYTVDYNSIGNAAEGNKSITLWIDTGRDQANILKRLIESSFTPKTGIGVNLKLVTSATLLPSVVAGKGPDIVIGAGEALPIDYAIRGAVADLSKFDGFNDIKKRFFESALVPYTFMGKIYALPETQTFDILYYRKDILDDLNLNVPETWDDVYSMIPALSRKNMTVGIPTSMRFFATLLYQNNGQFYTKDGSKSMLDSLESMLMFEKWTDFFYNYKIPVEMDFSNRFRTGEMPLGIADFSVFNTLSIFAPEIAGLWDIAMVPGSRLKDGSINRSSAGSVTGCIMLESSKKKNETWEFMKWWTSKEIQASYGLELESLLGEAARYPTANFEAFEEIPWQKSTYESIQSRENG